VRRSARTGIAAKLIAAIPALSACASGFGAETRNQGATVDGASTNVSDGVVIRNAFVLVPSDGVSPERSSVQLYATIVNGGSSSDRVTDVRTDVSSSVRADTSTQVAAFDGGVFGEQRVTFTLSGINQELRDGDHVPVTLHFENAGDATLLVPVVGSQPYYTELQTSTPTP
jgi:copper(I)-binding protein